MLKILNWAVPLMVCVLLIQLASDVLYVRALEYQRANGDDRNVRRERARPGPVHEIERAASSRGIVT
jgi:hypothetical protein